MLNKLIALSIAFLFSTITPLSSANIIDTVDFKITNNAGSLQDWGSNWAAMGFANIGDTITGSFNIGEGDTTASHVTNFLLDVNGTNHAITAVSGSLSWSGASVIDFSFNSVSGPDFGFFYVYSNNTANVSLNGVGQVVCNGCVSITSTSPDVAVVPEPGMLALLGLGIISLAVTRRRNRSV